MRERFGPIAITIIVGAIALVFTFSGVLSPDVGMSGAVVGAVDGDPISLSEFSREYQRRMAFFQNLKMNPAQLGGFNIKKNVFNELVNRRLQIAEAKRMGFMPSKAAVRDQIREMEVFKKDGQFDLLTYEQVLQANQFTPGTFERLIRSDLILRNWRVYFRKLVTVSQKEVEEEYRLSENKRKVKYVHLNSEVGRKGVLKKVSQAEVDAYLKDSSRKNLVKSRFEAKKTTSYKGKTFDQVKREIARDLIATSKVKETREFSEELARKVLERLGKSAASDKKVNELLKPYGVTVKTSSEMTLKNAYLPGVGEVKELTQDAFGSDQTLQSKGKVYSAVSGPLVALLVEEKTPDMNRLDRTEFKKIADRIVSQKQQELYGDWIESLEKKAKIVVNEDVLNSV